MIIRPICPQDDFGAIANIYVKGWKEGYKGIVPQPYLDDLHPNRWQNILKSSSYNSLVVLDKGKYIATSSFAKNRNDQDKQLEGWGEIISFYVLPSHWQKGVGSRLLLAVTQSLYAMGFTYIYLWVLKENKRARQFYEKNGFIVTSDEMTITIAGKNLVEVRYAMSSPL